MFEWAEKRAEKDAIRENASMENLHNPWLIEREKKEEQKLLKTSRSFSTLKRSLGIFRLYIKRIFGRCKAPYFTPIN